MNRFYDRPTSSVAAVGICDGDMRVVSFTSDKTLPTEGKETSQGTLRRLLSPRPGSFIQPNFEQAQVQPQQQQGFAAIKRKEKRMTLPFMVSEPASQQIRGLISPSHLAAANRRISFTYRSFIQALSYSLTRSNNGRAEPSQYIKKEQKQIVQSGVQLHPPSKGIGTDQTARTRNHISFIEEEPQNKGVYDSKIASTIASRSSFRQRAKNDFALTLQPTCSRQSSSHCIKNPSSLNIQDSSSSKNIAPSNQLQPYSFGGLFSRSLLNTSNLKQSIHCGPEVRLERPCLQLLDRFGREIKESTLSFCE